MTQLKHLDWVVVADTCPDIEDRGRTGYVMGQVHADQCGVYFEPTDPARGGLGEYICFSPADLRPTGKTQPEPPPGQSLRVNARGEVL